MASIFIRRFLMNAKKTTTTLKNNNNNMASNETLRFGSFLTFLKPKIRKKTKFLEDDGDGMGARGEKGFCWVKKTEYAR